MPDSARPNLERLPTVLKRTGLSRSAVYEAIDRGTFPRSVPIGARAVAYVSTEIDAWIAQRIAERDARLPNRHTQTSRERASENTAA